MIVYNTSMNIKWKDISKFDACSHTGYIEINWDGGEQYKLAIKGCYINSFHSMERAKAVAEKLFTLFNNIPDSNLIP